MFGWTDRQTDRQTDSGATLMFGWTDRQTDRQRCNTDVHFENLTTVLSYLFLTLALLSISKTYRQQILSALVPKDQKS